MWLRDWLGPDLTDRGCSARIFTYGYPAVVANSSSDASYHDYGRVLLDSLTSARRRQYKVPNRPALLLKRKWERRRLLTYELSLGAQIKAIDSHRTQFGRHSH